MIPLDDALDRDLVMELPTDIQSIEGAVDYVMSHCAVCIEQARRLNLNFRVGLTEALSNAMLYGNGRDPSKSVVLEVVLREGTLRAKVRDQGVGFDPNAVPDPTLPENLARPCGRGLFLMRELLDEVSYNERGNEVTLVLRLDTANPLEGGARA
ncbi:MAG: ATP-binding protein [Longimicrobiales bacterium]|nr:ATP-binding protein [Longimicrobiales bacterium]